MTQSATHRNRKAFKMTKDSSDDNEFDISRFLDMGDDEPVESADDTGEFSLEAIPFDPDSVKTAKLDLDIFSYLEDYFRGGKVPRAEKKNLRELARLNAETESILIPIEQAIVSSVENYRSLISGIIRENKEVGSIAINDRGDPYDLNPFSVEGEFPGSRDVRIKADDLFREISELESKRRALNESRRHQLEGIISGSRENLTGFAELVSAAKEKIVAIEDVQDFSSTRISVEDERVFDRDAEEFRSYISGEFDPLEEEENDEPIGAYVGIHSAEKFDEPPLVEQQENLFEFPEKLAPENNADSIRWGSMDNFDEPVQSIEELYPESFEPTETVDGDLSPSDDSYEHNVDITPGLAETGICDDLDGILDNHIQGEQVEGNPVTEVVTQPIDTILNLERAELLAEEQLEGDVPGEFIENLSGANSISTIFPEPFDEFSVGVENWESTLTPPEETSPIFDELLRKYGLSSDFLNGP